MLRTIVSKLPAEPLGALLHPLLRPVQVAASVVGADALEHRVEMAVVVRPVDALEPVLRAHCSRTQGRVRRQLVQLIVGAAAERGARLER